MSSSRNEELELSAVKMKKLREQAELSDTLNQILTRENGMIQSSQQTCKNLEVAVAVSKRPGFFEYYTAPDDVVAAHNRGDLGQLAKKIGRVQKELDNVDQELATKQAMRTSAVLPAESNMSSLQQWFAMYGQPKPSPHGFLTTFQNNSKIYGGTQNHRAFKTQSKAMKQGRLIR